MDQTKWEATVSSTLEKATTEQVWPLFTDFFNLNKWLPALPICYGLSGVNGEPGCVRYCAGISPVPPPENQLGWSKERLIAVDHDEHCLRYEIVDSNIGLNSYVSTVKVVPVKDGSGGCKIQWSIELEPIKGCVLDDLVDKYQSALQTISQTMEAYYDVSKQVLIAEPKWEGKAAVELKGLTADQVWPCVSDFCNVHLYFPGLETCYKVEGELAQPGLVRYCQTSPQPDGSGGTRINWVKERLVMIDSNERCMSYDIVENNLGFKSYLATFRVEQFNGGDQPGCKIEWSFVSDPVEGMTPEDLHSYMNTVLEFMAKKIEDVVSAASS